MTSSLTTTDGGIAYEPFEAASKARAFEWYEVLREQAPVHHTPSGYWLVSRYADVRDIFMHPEKFSSAPIYDEGFGLPRDFDPSSDPEFLERLLALAAGMPVDIGELLAARPIVAADPPQHTRLRAIVSKAFKPSRIAEMEAKIRTVVDGCLEGIEDTDVFDVVERLAVTAPVHTIADLLSIEPEHRADIKRWSDMMLETAIGDNRGTTAATATLMQVFSEFSNYLVPRIEALRAEPADSLLSDLVRAADADSLSVTECVLFVFTIMAAGNETTTSLIGSMVHSLMAHRDQLDLLLERPELIPNAVEEAARYRSPLQFLWREPLEPVTIAGVDIPKGDIILILLGSANHDPRQFPDPGRFDVTRDVGGTLAFGHGIHFCLGYHLGRMQARVALERILPHLGQRRLVDEPLEFTGSYVSYSYEHVRLERV